MDCWWNSAVENQGLLVYKSLLKTQTLNQRIKAIDRVHRIGQDKTVYVKHFIVSIMNHFAFQR